MALFGNTNGKAIVSLLLGITALGLTCITGIPAMILGFAGLREINRSDGAEAGRTLAIAGMVLGALGTLAITVGLGVMLFQQVREVGNIATCQNNLRQIGFALQFYNDRNDTFPAGTVVNEALKPEQRLSWYTSLLPFLAQGPPGSKVNRNGPWYRMSEELDLHQGWEAEANRKVAMTPIRGLVCPSWTGTLNLAIPVTTYLGIAGVGKDGPYLPAEDPRAGVFAYDRGTRLGQITRGISNTAMVIETGHDPGPWAAGGPPTVRPVIPKQAPYLGDNHPFGGLHPHICNTLFVDGSVRPLDDAIEAQVFEDLCTIRAKGK